MNDETLKELEILLNSQIGNKNINNENINKLDIINTKLDLIISKLEQLTR